MDRRNDDTVAALGVAFVAVAILIGDVDAPAVVIDSNRGRAACRGTTFR